MASFTTSELSRRSGDVIAAALRRPVTITQRDTPRLVLMSIEDFKKLTESAGARQAMTLETMPDDVFEAMRKGVAEYEAGKE